MSKNPSELIRQNPRSAESAGAAGFNLHTALIALRCWWKVATPVGLLLAAGSAVAVFYVTKPTYTATTWIEIRESPDVVFSQAAASDPANFARNQLEYLRSPLVLDAVAAIPAVDSTPELQADGDPAQSLRRRIRVQSKNNSELFVIEFTSESPEKAALITNEVAKSFLEMQRRAESRRFEKTVELLERLQTTQGGVVKWNRDNLREATKLLTGKDPFAAATDQNKIQTQHPLADLQSMLVAHQLRQEVLTMELATERRHFENQSFEPSPTEVERQVNADPIVADLRKTVAELKVKIKGHEERSGNLQQNTAYAALQRELTEKESALAKSEQELRGLVKDSLQKGARQIREQEIAALADDLAQTESSVTFLNDKLTQKLQSQKEYQGETLDLAFTKAEYERSTAVYEKVADRLMHLKMQREAQQRVSIVQEAVIPRTPDEAIPYKKMGTFGLGAFVIPFGLAVLFEVLYRRVSSRDQLESHGKVRVVGEVPALPRRPRSRKPLGPDSNRELQLFEESVDGLRTYLTLVESLRGMQVLAITSAISREGKTSLAAQLAVSVASATGEPTLLIDGDMRSPDIHQIFGVENKPGLAAVLGGQCSLQDAIETEFSNSLHVLPAGQLQSSPHRLLGNGEFAALIEKLRGVYRYILIDTPPILPASESLVMARAADAAVLCARRDYSRIDQVAEAHHRLEAAGVKAAGAVLNGIPSRDYAQRYGSYYYNRTRLPRRLRKAEAPPN